MSRDRGKPGLWIFDQDKHKPAYAGQKKTARSLKISDLRRGLVHPCSENKGADQLCCYCTADLWLCCYCTADL